VRCAALLDAAYSLLRLDLIVQVLCSAFGGGDLVDHE
jgi:hypothetical protein